jgi:hypothetical protein
VQIFSQRYPEFDYVWQLEMDSRNTGHAYHFFDKAVEFAKRQPRKYLWERNAYFYTPEAHGTWEEFMDMVDNIMPGRPSVWGPLPADEVKPVGPKPPVASPEIDDYEWGVGEEAEFITFLPIFDPQNTLWTFPDKIWNFQQGLDTPRRSAVITMSRSSRRLLNVMHEAQARSGLGLVSEMTAPSWSLHHGLKAVYVPHPMGNGQAESSQAVSTLVSPRKLTVETAVSGTGITFLTTSCTAPVTCPTRRRTFSEDG